MAVSIKQKQRRLSHEELMHIVRLRYGDLLDYKSYQMSQNAISKVTGVRQSTISAILRRFVANGYLFQSRRSNWIEQLSKQEFDFLMDL